MARNLDPKCKQCRRIGEKLFLKGARCGSARCGIVKRNFPPGPHGAKGKPRMSGYGEQLQEKQKAKKTYHLLEKQFVLTFEKAGKEKGDKGKNFLRLLETRLDNTVYRTGFADSRDLSRQLVSHGHFLVNGKKVNIASFQVKTGDIVSVKESSKRQKYFRQLLEKKEEQKNPSWLNVDKKALSAKVLHAPTDDDIPSNINTAMIVEFYSR
ncbi:MAG: 30S ribosomal protein S4 [Patescibacteria group bacterium]|jgi:small subunit ribosomal protein S4